VLAALALAALTPAGCSSSPLPSVAAASGHRPSHRPVPGGLRGRDTRHTSHWRGPALRAHSRLPNVVRRGRTGQSVRGHSPNVQPTPRARPTRRGPDSWSRCPCGRGG